MINKRVVITGIGIYSCIGKNINEVTNSLKEGKSGIGIDSVRTDMGYRSSLTGIIGDTLSFIDNSTNGTNPIISYIRFNR